MDYREHSGVKPGRCRETDARVTLALVKTRRRYLVRAFPDGEVCRVPGRHVVLGFSLAELANGAGGTFGVDIPAAHLSRPAVVRLRLLDRKKVRAKMSRTEGGTTVTSPRSPQRLAHGASVTEMHPPPPKHSQLVLLCRFKMDGCAVLACLLLNLPSLFGSFWENTEKPSAGQGAAANGGGGRSGKKKNWRQKRLAWGFNEARLSGVAKTYPGGSVCGAVVRIARPLHFTSVHSQKIASLQGNANTHTHFRRRL